MISSAFLSFSRMMMMLSQNKSYNPHIGTSLKCVLMCRASGKWIQHDSTIPNLVLGHVRILVMVAGLKYGLPAFWLRSSFGP